jgi:hypothetical protein
MTVRYVYVLLLKDLGYFKECGKMGNWGNYNRGNNKN